MRYLYLLLFVFLSLQSYFLFADDAPPEPICTGPTGEGGTYEAFLSDSKNSCLAADRTFFSSVYITGTGPYGAYHKTICKTNCACPPGSTWFQNVDVGGNKTSGCSPNGGGDGTGEECPNGRDPVTGQCSNDDLCPSGYPKVNGQCPVCVGDYNEDGTCATPSSEPSSSAPNSSSPDTGSSGSAGSAGSAGGGGDDGDGGTPGGGGGDGGNGGNNGGGGSASAASASSASGTGNSSGAGSSSGANNSWNPYSGYGNWIPISEDSPCPNKYQDISGQWWCAGNGAGTSAGSTGSAGSVASTGSSAGQCDPTSRDYLQCISSGNSSAQSQSSQSSSAGSASSGAASSLGEKGEFDGEDSEKRLEELEEELANKIDEIKQDIKNEFTSAIRGSGTIEDFCKNIYGKEVCFGMKKFESWLSPISTAIFLVACVISFSIVLSGRN